MVSIDPVEQFKLAIAAGWHISVPWILVLISSSLLDVVFGLAAAFVKGTISSSVMRQGMARKLVMLATILSASIVDGIVPRIPISIFGMNLVLTCAAVGCLYWTLVEWLSVVEKAGMLGLPIPKRLLTGLVKVRAEIDGSTTTTTTTTTKGPPSATSTETKP